MPGGDRRGGVVGLQAPTEAFYKPPPPCTRGPVERAWYVENDIEVAVINLIERFDADRRMIAHANPLLEKRQGEGQTICPSAYATRQTRIPGCRLSDYTCHCHCVLNSIPSSQNIPSGIRHQPVFQSLRAMTGPDGAACVSKTQWSTF